MTDSRPNDDGPAEPRDETTPEVPAQEPHTEQFEPASAVPATEAYSQSPRVDTAQFDHGPETTQLDDGFTPIPAAEDTAPPNDGVPPVTTSSPSRRNRGKILGFVAVGLVLLLVIGAVGSELILRKRTQDCLQNAFSQLTGTETSVTLSKKPMLLQAFGSEIPFIQVDTDDNAGGDMRLHARVEGVSETDNVTTLRTLNGTGFLPFERVKELGTEAAAGSDQSGQSGQSGIGSLVGGSEIQSITGNPDDGTITVESGVQVTFLKIPVSATIKPVVDGGKVRFEVEKASALMFGIPSDFAQQIVDQVSTSLFGPFFDEVNVKELKVTEQGVDFAVDGTDVQLTSQVTGGDAAQCR